MGRTFDVLLGRKFKPAKFKATVNVAVSRVTVLKKKHQARLRVARSDVIQLLNLNHHEPALLRVDEVIKEQNMLDVLVMVDGYCHLLLQLINLIEKEKDCPEELKEAVSSLLYAAKRCGEFPELQEVSEVLTSRYGKEFARGATELRNNCGVNRRMIEKLSTRQSSLETRMKILQAIEAEKNGVVQKHKDSYPVPRQGDEESTKSVSNNGGIDDEVSSSSESRKGKKNYSNVEDAARAVYEFAAHTSEAAQAVVEFSRNRSFGSDSPNSRPRRVVDPNNEKLKLKMKIEETHEEGGETSKNDNTAGDSSGSDSDGNIMTLEKRMVSDGSDDEIDSFVDAESRLEEELKMQPLDLTKRPMSVRNRRVYGP